MIGWCVVVLAAAVGGVVHGATDDPAAVNEQTCPQILQTEKEDSLRAMLCHMRNAALLTAELSNYNLVGVERLMADNHIAADETDAATMEKRKHEYLRFGKRKHEYLRFGKRKHEYLRFGKRKHEFLRFNGK